MKARSKNHKVTGVWVRAACCFQGCSSPELCRKPVHSSSARGWELAGQTMGMKAGRGCGSLWNSRAFCHHPKEKWGGFVEKKEAGTLAW